MSLCYNRIKMRFRNKIFMMLAAGVWILPALANASHFSARQDPIIPEPQAKIGGPSLEVVSAVSSASIVPASPDSTAAVCNVAGPPTSTLVQDQGPINLNQPSSCFDLSTGHVAVQSELAVAHFQTSSEIRVLNSPSATIFAYQMAPYTSGASLPVLPLSAFSLPLMAAAVMLILAKDRTRKIISQRRDVLSLIQLQVMRC